MTRNLNATMSADLAAATAEEIQFIELQFSAATSRFCTAAWDVVWNGQTWQAIGGQLDMEGFTESPEQSQNGMRLTLCGVDTSVIAQVLTSDFIGRPAKIWHGHINMTTGAIVGGAAGPVLMFDGMMNDSWEINETHGQFGGGEVIVTTRLAARISEIDKVRGIKTNITSHQSCGIPGVTTDTFFMNVPGLVGVRDSGWGKPKPPNPQGGPRGRERDRSQGAPKPWGGGGGGGPRPPSTPPKGADHPDNPHHHG